MILSTEQIQNKLRAIYHTIEFLESSETTTDRFRNSQTIVFTYKTPFGDDRVLKFYSLQHLDEEQKLSSKAELFEEYNIITRFNHHSNIVGVYEVNEVWDKDELIGIYMTMEKFKMTLRKLIKEKKKFSDEEIIGFLEQMSDILETAHYKLSEPIVHSDIKPSNIGVRILEGVKYQYALMDFDVSVGLERTKGEQFTLSNKAILRGLTPAYAPPEQVLAMMHQTGTISNRVDIYAVGAIALEMQTGLQPKKLESEVYYQLPLDKVSANLKDIIHSLCDMDTKKRPKLLKDILSKDNTLIDNKINSKDTVKISQKSENDDNKDGRINKLQEKADSHSIGDVENNKQDVWVSPYMSENEISDVNSLPNSEKHTSKIEKSVDPRSANDKNEESVIPVGNSLTSIFNRKAFGVNYYIGICLFIALALKFILWSVIYSMGRYEWVFYSHLYTSPEYISYIISNIIFYSVTFILFLHVVKNDWLIALLIGIGTVIVTYLMAFIFDLLTVNELINRVDINLENLFFSFAWSFFLIVSIIISLKTWGFKWWSLAFWICIGNIVAEILLWSILLIKYRDIPFDFISLLTSIIEGILLGTAFYFGVHLFQKQKNSKGLYFRWM